MKKQPTLQTGFTLIEVLVAAFILSLGIAAIALVQMRNAKLNLSANQHTLIDQFANDLFTQVQTSRSVIRQKKGNPAALDAVTDTICNNSSNDSPRARLLQSLNVPSSSLKITCTRQQNWLSLTISWPASHNLVAAEQEYKTQYTLKLL